jgi:hypothetical protein
MIDTLPTFLAFALCGGGAGWSGCHACPMHRIILGRREREEGILSRLRQADGAHQEEQQELWQREDGISGIYRSS